jgi:hypothetical protein
LAEQFSFSSHRGARGPQAGGLSQNTVHLEGEEA